MKTENLIEKLSQDLKKSTEAKNWFSQYWVSWMFCFLVMGGITFVASVYLPEDIHLPFELHRISFWFEVGAWFVIAWISAWAAYASSIPGRPKPTSPRLVYALLAVLFISVVSRSSPSAFAQEIANEAHLLQGPCGIFIALTGMLGGLWMFSRIKSAAPVNLIFTGAWSAASVGSLGAMFMNLVCTHESSAHLVIWHMVPLMSLILLASAVSRRVLHW